MKTALIALGFIATLNGCASMTPQQEERLRRALANYNHQQSSQEVVAYRPNPQMLYIQSQQPVKSKCQSRWVNGTMQSDCTSQASGIDTSIYGQ